jgi:signal transduction histidine kinase
MATDGSRQLGQESVLAQIETAIASPLWNERLAAIDLVAGLLEDLPSEKTVVRLIEILDRLARDGKWEVRRAVAPVLVAARRPAARGVVEQLIDDDHPWVRQAAQRAKRKLSRVTSPADKHDPRAHFAFEAIRDLDGRSAAKAYQAAMRIGERYYEELAADTAHELNTYRTAIEGLVEELEVRIKARGDVVPGLFDILQKIRDRSRSFRALVDGLLAFTRDAELPFEVEPLEPIVREALVLAQDKSAVALADRKVETVVRVPEALRLETRKARLHQAIANVLSNALESLAGAPGQARVTIEVESNSGDRLRLTVTDTGVGMEAEQVEHATKRFSSLKRDKGGIGLGLPLAVKIVEEHGGRLDIDSAPGEGTTVTIELPLRQGPA